MTIELRGPGSVPTLGNNGGCQHNRSRSAREFAWTLKFESLQSTDGKSPQKDATTLIGSSFLPNDTQWWLIRATEIALVVYVAFYSARSDVWSYVGIVEDFMYKGHWCNRHLNRHGYVMHPTRENQQVKNRLWERVPSPFHIDQTKIRNTNQNPTKKNNKSSIRRQPRHDRRHSWSWFCCWYC